MAPSGQKVGASVHAESSLSTLSCQRLPKTKLQLHGEYPGGHCSPSQNHPPSPLFQLSQPSPHVNCIKSHLHAFAHDNDSPSARMPSSTTSTSLITHFSFLLGAFARPICPLVWGAFPPLSTLSHEGQTLLPSHSEHWGNTCLWYLYVCPLTRWGFP